MKIGYLINNIDLIKKINKIPLSVITTKEALEIRKVIKKINEKISLFEETQNQYISQNGEKQPDGTYSIVDPIKVKSAKKYLNNLANEEIDVDWNPMFTEELLEKIKLELQLTIEDIDALEEMNLLKI